MHTHENVAGTLPRDILQRHVPSWELVLLSLCNTNIWGILCTHFNLLNFMGHVAGTKYHIHATRPCYMSPQCALKFFIASTCPCNMTPRVCSPLARREHRTVNLSFSTFNSTGIPPVHFYHILCQQYRGEQEGIIKK